MSTGQRSVGIVIPVKDSLAVTRQCVEALFEHTDVPFHLILVDNGSKPEVADWARQLGPTVTFIRNQRNEGFSFACNQGLAAGAEGAEWLVVMNNDVIVTDGWLSEMLAVARSDASIGMVGPRTNRASGPQQVDAVGYRAEDVADDRTALSAFAREWARENAGRHQRLSRLVGLCVLLRRDLVERVGGFDTCFWLGNFEDDDLCLRTIRAGFELVVAHGAFVHHHGSSTWKEERLDYARLMHDNWRWFRHKWEFEQALGSYPARRLAQLRPFDTERDVVPLDYGEVFSAEAEPLALDAARGTRLLLIADGVDNGWADTFASVVTAFGPDDDVTLILRLDPPTQDVVDRVTRGVERVLQVLGVDESEAPDVMLDVSWIPPRRRGGLYTAASALLATNSQRFAMYRREAGACGLRVVDDLLPGNLRSATALTTAR